jgi:serine/threonine-protein kinase RsbW
MRDKTFPGRYDSLASISEFVAQAARAAGLTEHAVYAVQLAVDEACCNIIDHAYGGEGRGDIRCSVDIGKGQLTVVLRDRGRPFDPAKVPPPVLNRPLKRVKPRGVGLYLMRKMMDEVRYEPSQRGENVWIMVKRR